MEYFIAVIISLLIGSFPSAYVIIKFFNGKDIRKEGSGNVGAYNSVEVSESKLIGLAVFVLDFIKGVIPVFLTIILLESNYILVMTVLVSAVLSHCYNPWLKFKGGRGLATAAGGLILISYPVVIIWVALWLIAYLFRKSIHFANIAATSLTALLSWNVGDILFKYSHPIPEDYIHFSISISLIMLIILARHFEYIKTWLTFQKKNSRGNNEDV